MSRVMNKRYYWLKLKEDFFNDLKIKKLRKTAGGDTYTIIYLKLLILSLPDKGILFFENVEETFPEELALIIHEEIENVKFTLAYMNSQNLIQKINQYEYLLPETKFLTGSETASTIRSKRCRERKALQCNINAAPLQLQCSEDTDKDKEIEKDTDKESIIGCIPANEYSIFKVELLNRGWSGNLDNLIEEIGWDVCIFYWDNQLKQEFDNSTSKLGGGWITNKFRKDAKVYFDYYQNKMQKEKNSKNSKINSLKIRKKKFKSSENNFLNEFQNFINSNNHTDQEKFILNEKNYKTIDDLKIHPGGILEHFLDWRGIT